MRDNRNGPGSGGNTCRSLTDPHQALRKMRMAETQRTRTCSIESGDKPRRTSLRSPEERFSAHTEARGDCLNWTGQIDSYGYGQMWDGTRLTSPHRYAWVVERGPIPAGMEIDHRCHNRICCNLAHLRIATRKQNQENVDMRSDNTSGHRGVYWDKRDQKWRVQVRHNGRKHSAGYFTDLLEAAEVAKSLRNALFSFNDTDRKEAN